MMRKESMTQQKDPALCLSYQDCPSNEKQKEEHKQTAQELCRYAQECVQEFLKRVAQRKDKYCEQTASKQKARL